MTRHILLLLLAKAIVVSTTVSVPVALPASASAPAISDSLYNAHHPRLLFDVDDLEWLRVKVRDGGADDAAMLFIRDHFETVYRLVDQDSLLDDDFAQDAIPIMGLLTHLDGHVEAEQIGRDLVLYVAGNWDVDSYAYYSALRLRALAIGYDMFFQNASEGDRGLVRDEMLAYLQYMLTSFNYEIWWHPPYTSNVSAMVAASMGLASIVLQDEADASLLTQGIDTADDLFHTWLNQHVDPNGSYTEGTLYGAWSLRNLVYFFHARERFDGTDYGAIQKIRNMEEWFAYELSPLGGGHVNNIQDCTWWDYPLPRHTSYFDWAQSKWGSGLSKYIWRRVAGPGGYDYGDKADKVGTVLWNTNLLETHPSEVLSGRGFWPQRGLYYYRSGWPAVDSSDDVVFSFYSGEFRGGHAQEDQNQFTLTAYGEKLVVDHGIGTPAKETEAHNLVLIDNQGQHNAGSSIGTDGRISERLFGTFSDVLVGDAADAYSTHSPLNNPDVPFEGLDWSWGYGGANHVQKAERSIVVVHDADKAPYFLVLDDILKDGDLHLYDWRLHTLQSHSVDVSGNPMRIMGGDATLDIHMIYPNWVQSTRSTFSFDNQQNDPDATVLSVQIEAVNPFFAFLLFPDASSIDGAQVETNTYGALGAAFLRWPDGATDFVIVSQSAVATFLFSMASLWPSAEAGPAPAELAVPFQADARVVVGRVRSGELERFLLVDGSELWFNGVQYVDLSDGPGHVDRGADAIHISRVDAAFRIFAPGVSDVYGEGEKIYVVDEGGYLTPDPITGIDGPAPFRAGLQVRVNPNPFNPGTRIQLRLPERTEVRIVVYDALGREVREIHHGAMPAGSAAFEWDGRTNSGRPAASGVYLLAVTAGSETQTRKLTLLK